MRLNALFAEFEVNFVCKRPCLSGVRTVRNNKIIGKNGDIPYLYYLYIFGFFAVERLNGDLKYLLLCKLCHFIPPFFLQISV